MCEQDIHSWEIDKLNEEAALEDAYNRGKEDGTIASPEVELMRRALLEILSATRYDNAVGQLKKIEKIARKALR